MIDGRRRPPRRCGRIAVNSSVMNLPVTTRGVKVNTANSLSPAQKQCSDGVTFTLYPGDLLTFTRLLVPQIKGADSVKEEKSFDGVFFFIFSV